MDSICFFRLNQSCRGISVLPAFSLSNLSAVNRFRSMTSLRFGFSAPPFRPPKFSFETHAKKKKTNTVEPKQNKVEDLLFEEEYEEEEDEEELVLPEEIQDGVF